LNNDVNNCFYHQNLPVIPMYYPAGQTSDFEILVWTFLFAAGITSSGSRSPAEQPGRGSRRRQRCPGGRPSQSGRRVGGATCRLVSYYVYHQPVESQWRWWTAPTRSLVSPLVIATGTVVAVFDTKADFFICVKTTPQSIRSVQRSS